MTINEAITIGMVDALLDGDDRPNGCDGQCPQCTTGVPYDQDNPYTIRCPFCGSPKVEHHPRWCDTIGYRYLLYGCGTRFNICRQLGGNDTERADGITSAMIGMDCTGPDTSVDVI